jgi:xylose dehydrogenase (NAD/NADP)
MSNRKIRWGILGVAKINERLIPAFHKAERASLLAIASRNKERAQAAATAGHIPIACGSYEELLSRSDIDAVYIPLPNTLHDEWTRRAADAGKHILCEKPLTPTATQAADLIAYCQARGVLLMDGFMWPHHPRTALLRQIIDRGTIGAVRRVTGTFTFRLPLDPANIRLQAGMAGGSLLDVGCYPVYGIRWAFGSEPLRVLAIARYEYQVDLEMSALLTFGDGRIGAFDCGFTQPMRQWLEITGTEGVLRIPRMWLPEPEAAFCVELNEKEPQWHTCPGHDQIVCMLDNFSRAILEDTAVRPDPSEAVASLRVLDALQASGVRQQPVAL